MANTQAHDFFLLFVWMWTNGGNDMQRQSHMRTTSFISLTVWMWTNGRTATRKWLVDCRVCLKRAYFTPFSATKEHYKNLKCMKRVTLAIALFTDAFKFYILFLCFVVLCRSFFTQHCARVCWQTPTKCHVIYYRKSGEYVWEFP